MKILDRLIKSFRRMPGVGPKQAERFAIYLLKAKESEIQELITAIGEVRNSVKLCSECFNYSFNELCDICSDKSRENNIICVVENVMDLDAIEKTGFYKGLYHVLGALVSPIDGINQSNIRIKELMERVERSQIDEIIIATNPSSQGDITAMYIKNLLENKVPKISRIAMGIPLGGDINYMDEMTLIHSIKGRRKI